MPIERVNGGYRFGKTGKIYHGPNAYILARRQGAAISISKGRRSGHDIPVLKRR